MSQFCGQPPLAKGFEQARMRDTSSLIRVRAFAGGFRGRIQTPIDDHEALTGVSAGQGLI